MSRVLVAILYLGCIFIVSDSMAQDEGVTKFEELPTIADKVQLNTLREKSYRGKIYPFALLPSTANALYDSHVFYADEKGEMTSVKRSLRIDYKREQDGFCGTYLVVLGDVSHHRSLIFRVKGAQGGENFILGMKDLVSHDREDAVLVGSIHRYLPEGVTTEWQEVRVPLEDARGIDCENFFGLVFLFEDVGGGTIYVDDVRFGERESNQQQERIASQGYLVLDDFDHADINNLGLPSGCYMKFPSLARAERIVDKKEGGSGKSLRIEYKKSPAGWAGYYTMLHHQKREFTDLATYGALSFRIRGEEGGESVRVGVADRHYILLDDAVMLGDVAQYMDGAISKDWKDVVIPFQRLEGLDLASMGSIIFDFEEEGSGVIYVDDLRFTLSPDQVSQATDASVQESRSTGEQHL